jgi:hypothetical protein
MSQFGRAFRTWLEISNEARKMKNGRYFKCKWQSENEYKIRLFRQTRAAVGL